MNDLDWKKPALMGGLIVGVGSLIPFLNFFNFVCCGWAWIGGMVAVRMLVTRSPRRLIYADGAKIGLAVGVIGGLICFVIQAPLFALQMGKVIQTATSNPQFPPELVENVMQIQQSPILRVLVALGVNLILSLMLAAFSVLGGIAGVAIFEKRPVDPYGNAQSS